MTDTSYRDLLRRYYEEEVEGEAYFRALAERAPDEHARAKLILLAEVERRAAELVAPLLARHGLTSRDPQALAESGRAFADREERRDWPAFIDHMARHYPSYLDDFARIEALAPDEDRAALDLLTRHEVEAIAFAERERAGDPDSAAPLRRYLADTEAQLR